MPTTEPSVTTSTPSLPRYAVSLRLAYYLAAMGGMEFNDFLILLTTETPDGERRLCVYECATSLEPLRVSDPYDTWTGTTYPDNASDSERLALFQPDHFVWSDELATAVPTYFWDNFGWEQGNPKGAGLSWTADLLQRADLMEESLDLTSLAPPRGTNMSKKELRDWMLRARNRRWSLASQKLQKADPNITLETVAKNISKLPIAEDCSPATILRNIKKVRS